MGNLMNVAFEFCKSCGKPLEEFKDAQGAREISSLTPNLDSEASGTTTNELKREGNQLVDKVKVLPKKVLIGISAAIIALIVIICIVVNARSTINLNKYITIEASGYEGYGTVDATIDWDAIEEKYGDKVSFTSQGKKAYGNEILSNYNPVDILGEAISVELENTSNLSNDDTITYTWDIDEDLSKYVKCKIKYKDDSYTVSGLKKASKFDAFADLDEVTLKAMQQQASDVLNANWAQNTDESTSLKGMTYIGDYLLTMKQGASVWGNQNMLYLVYKVQIENSYSNDEESYNKIDEIYWYISFYDLMLDSEGALSVDVTDYRRTYDKVTIDSGVTQYWNTKTWSYYGYLTLDDLYKAVVTSDIDSYNHEDNVDESIAKEKVY